MRRRRQHAVLIAAICVAAGVTCSDRGTGPSSGLLSRIGFRPALTEAASQIYRDLVTFGLDLDNIRLRLTRAGGEVVKDTVIALGANQDEVRVELTIPLRAPEELLTALVELRDGTVVLFSGTQEIIARPGQSGGGDSEPLVVTYTGPGADAVSLSVSPSERSIFTTDSVDYVATATNQNQQSVPVVAIAWSVEDPSRGTVSASGRFKPSQTRGSTHVIAKLPTGLTAQALVTITPVASQMAVQSGGNQNGTVATALAQPIVVEVKAFDNLPSVGTRVDFAIGTGGGSLSALTATTDANGRASTTLTLGTVAGANSVVATVANVAPLTINATANAGAATTLVMVQQPSATATSGAPLAVQPRVRLQDAFGNSVSTSGVQVAAAVVSQDPITLGGTTTVATDANGVANFTDLSLVGLGGNATLSFSGASLASVTSNSIALSPAGVPTLTLETSGEITVEAGVTIEIPPRLLVRDANGNPQAGVPVRVVLTREAFTLYDQQHTSDQNGRVTVDQLPIPTSADSYLLTASNPAYTGSPVQVGITVHNSAAARLLFDGEPTGIAGTAGALLEDISVELFDAFGNLVTTGPTAATPVTLSLATGPTGAVLGPNPQALTQTSVNGQVTFRVSIDRAGTGYSLRASAGQLTPATTGLFDIGLAAVGSMQIVSGADQASLPRRFLPDSVVVRVLDAGGAPMAGFDVTFAIVSGGGMINGQTSPQQVTTDANGIAYVRWRVGAGPNEIRATAGAQTEDIQAHVADRIVIVTQPSLDPQSGVAFAQQPVVRFTDGAGHVIPTPDEEFIEAELVRTDAGQPSGALLSPRHVTANASGVGTFTQLTLAGPTTEQVQLRFFHQIDGENPDIAVALSAPINVRPGIPGFVFPGQVHHRLIPAEKRMLTFTVSDSINGIPNLGVTFEAAGNCALSSTAETTDAAGKVSVEVTAGPAYSSCFVMLQVAGVPEFTFFDWQRVYSAPPGVPVWTGGQFGDPDPTNWFVAANWYDVKIPDRDAIVFVPGAARVHAMVTAPITLDTLYLENFAIIDMLSNELTLTGSLRGGGQISGTVTLTALSNGLVSAFVSGLLRIGAVGAPLCNQAVSYTVETLLSATTLELNCPLVVDGTSFVQVIGDALVQGPNGMLLQGNGNISIGGGLTFNSPRQSLVADGSLTVVGTLNVSQSGWFDQVKGTIQVEKDAVFHGSSTMQDGMLRINGSMFYDGNGDNQKFDARPPHVTQFGATGGTPVINWNAPSQGTTKFGRLEFVAQAPAGYRFTTNNTFPTPVQIDDLLVFTGAQLTVDPNIVFNTGGTTGRGVNISGGGTLTNNGDVNVANFLQPLCSPLPRSSVVPGPFTCTTR